MKPLPPLYFLGLLGSCLFANPVQADPLDQWTWRNPLDQTSGPADDLLDITYGDHQFVAVGLEHFGNGGTILTSADGMTWTNRTWTRDQSLYGITYANHQFVVVGYDGPNRMSVILSSGDGITWAVPALEIDRPLQDIVYGDDQFVAVGEQGTILTSPDALAWTHRSSGTTSGLGGICYGNNQFVAVGPAGMLSDCAIVTSPDGITWTKRPPGTANHLYGVTCGNDTFVAVGREGTILQSGVVMTPQPALGPVVRLPGGRVQITLRGAVGQTYQFQASTNLIDWLTITNLTLTNTPAQFADPTATSFPLRFYRAVAE